MEAARDRDGDSGRRTVTNEIRIPSERNCHRAYKLSVYYSQSINSGEKGIVVEMKNPSLP